MSFFAQKKVWCKFLFIFLKNKKLMIFENFKAQICSHLVGKDMVKTLYSYAYNLASEIFQKSWKYLFHKTNVFFIPKELGIRAIYYISFVDNSGPVRVFLFHFQDFSIVWPCFGCSKVFLAHFVQESVKKIKHFIFHQNGHPSVCELELMDW